MKVASLALPKNAIPFTLLKHDSRSLGYLQDEQNKSRQKGKRASSGLLEEHRTSSAKTVGQTLVASTDDLAHSLPSSI